jgi:hypothetical protein
MIKSWVLIVLCVLAAAALVLAARGITDWMCWAGVRPYAMADMWHGDEPWITCR